ncbi:hypothetical protein TNCV_4123891 [Trichonephila clavipes]|nr:hypothetical protein TNCV_4123891 [Trichonephila clavipes]
MLVKSVRPRSPPVVVVWKFEEGVPAQVSFESLQNCEGRSYRCIIDTGSKATRVPNMCNILALSNVLLMQSFLSSKKGVLWNFDTGPTQD